MQDQANSMRPHIDKAFSRDGGKFEREQGAGDKGFCAHGDTARGSPGTLGPCQPAKQVLNTSHSLKFRMTKASAFLTCPTRRQLSQGVILPPFPGLIFPS